MANVAKHTRAAAGHLCAHYDRSEDNISNENIDRDRTAENYNLGPDRGITQMAFIQQRSGEVQCMKRKDVNVMCSWIVTSPQDLPPEDNRKFFEGAYAFLTARYGGEKNVISSYVHMDEITPHMHFAFVPVVADRRKGIDKVSAKECITKKDLQGFHVDLERYLSQIFGREVGILNDATRDGNKTVAELKREQIAQGVQEAEIKALEARGVLEHLEGQRTRLTGLVDALEDKLDGMTLSAKQIAQISVRPTRLSQIPGIHESRKEVIVSKSDWESVKKTAMQYPDPKLKADNKRLEREKKELQRQNAELKNKIPSVTEQLRIAGLESESRQLKRYIERIPADIRQRMEQDAKRDRRSYER